MNSQERDALNLFLQQLVQAQAGQKDPEAEALIISAISKQPDAAYLLVQRSMQFDILLQQAQTRMTEMQAELDRLKKSSDPLAVKPAETSFLGDIHAWGRSSASPSASSGGSGAVPGAVPSATATGPAPVNQTLRASAPPSVTTPAAPHAAAPSAWGSGLLGTVATTAAGVVAGSFLYHGIQSMMNNHGSGAGGAPAQAGRDSSGGSSDWTSAQQPAAGQVYTAYVDPADDLSSDLDDGYGDSGDGGDGE